MSNTLIIEDDMLLKWSLIETIKGEGLEVYTADNCLSAFEMAKKYKFRVIFVEVGVEKTETLEILNQIQAIQNNSRFVLMTSFPYNEIEDQTSDLRVLGILEKPFDLKKVRSLLRETSDIT